MSQCPKNDSLFQERSRRKNCKTLPQCTGEPLVYHCVRFREELVEVCAPRGLITSKHHQTNLILSLFPFCFDTYYTHVIVYVHPKYMFRKKNTLFVFIQAYPTCMHCIQFKYFICDGKYTLNIFNMCS